MRPKTSLLHRTRVRIDLLVALLAVAVGTALAIAFDLNEAWLAFSAAHEDWELDEAIVGLALGGVAFGWFGWRRARESYQLVDETTALNQQLEAEIVDRQAAQEDLQKAKENAELADAAKSRFLAHMSHELRTPLNAINGFSELIERQLYGEVGDPRYREYAEMIHRSGDHLLTIVNDILDLTKLDTGHALLIEEDLDLAELVDASLKLLGPRARAQGLAVGVDVPENIPLLRADARRMRQILINLLSNAIKFTESGGAVTVRVWADNADRLFLQVADTGVGMSAAEVEVALMPFRQIGNLLERQHEGTGLGLTIGRALVELHGGTLDMQSQTGTGTVVTVCMPASRLVARAA